jgi:hypothetical protein
MIKFTNIKIYYLVIVIILTIGNTDNSVLEIINYISSHKYEF